MGDSEDNVDLGQRSSDVPGCSLDTTI
jgi:hypothetical protein